MTQIPERGDDDLVKAALAGDRGAFGELVERYQVKIYNVALRVTGKPDDALDATQDAFLKAYSHLARFDPSHRFFSWIYRIGLNEALNVVNRRKRSAPLAAVPQIDDRPDPERRYQARETSRLVQETLLELEPHHRVMVVLRHLHGLSHQEMSEVIGIPVKTVKSRLFTARRLLRQRFEARGLVGDTRNRS